MIGLGLLERIFGNDEKEDEVMEEPEKISLEDVNVFIQRIEKETVIPLETSTKKYILGEYEKLQTAADNMGTHLDTLENAPYSTKEKPMLIRKAVGSRKTFVRKMRHLVDQIQKPIGTDMDSIIGFHNSTAKLMNVTNARTVREYSMLKELFGRYSTKVLDGFRHAVEIDQNIGSAIKEFKNSTRHISKAGEIHSEIMDIEEEIESMEKDLHMDAGRVDGEIREAERELETLPETKEWKRFLEMKDRKHELEEEMKEKKSEFVVAISRIHAPLKKYNWSEKNDVLDNYIDNSIESAVILDPGAEKFISAVQDMKKKMEDGDMDMGDNDRIISVLEKMIKGNGVGNIMERYSELKGELREQKQMIDSQDVTKKKQEMKNKIDRLKDEMDRKKTGRKRAQDSLNRLKAERAKKLKMLERTLDKISDKKVILDDG